MRHRVLQEIPTKQFAACMTPYQRIAIYQRLDHDRALAEKHLPCTFWKSCAGLRDEGPKCPACPLKTQ